MKKLLVLGASIAQIPFIKTTKKMGVNVAVVDYDSEAPAIEFADEYYNCSLLDGDGVLSIVEKYCPDGISCGASDVGVLTAAKVCKRLNLPSMDVDTAIKVKDKGEMIKAFETFNVAHPRYEIINSIDSEVNMEFPVVTKPVDNSGSRGINVAHSADELQKAIENSL